MGIFCKFVKTTGSVLGGGAFCFHFPRSLSSSPALSQCFSSCAQPPGWFRHQMTSSGRVFLFSGLLGVPAFQCPPVFIAPHGVSSLPCASLRAPLVWPSPSESGSSSYNSESIPWLWGKSSLSEDIFRWQYLRKQRLKNKIKQKTLPCMHALLRSIIGDYAE